LDTSRPSRRSAGARGRGGWRARRAASSPRARGARSGRSPSSLAVAARARAPSRDAFLQKLFFSKVSRDAFLMGPIPRATRAGNFGGLTPESAPPRLLLPERIALHKGRISLHKGRIALHEGGTRQGNRGPEPPRRRQVATPAGRSRASPCGSRRSMSWAEGARAGGDVGGSAARPRVELRWCAAAACLQGRGARRICR